MGCAAVPWLVMVTGPAWTPGPTTIKAPAGSVAQGTACKLARTVAPAGALLAGPTHTTAVGGGVGVGAGAGAGAGEGDGVGEGAGAGAGAGEGCGAGEDCGAGEGCGAGAGVGPPEFGSGLLLPPPPQACKPNKPTHSISQAKRDHRVAEGRVQGMVSGVCGMAEGVGANGGLSNPPTG